MIISGEGYEGLNRSDYPKTQATAEPQSAIAFIAGFTWRDVMQTFHAHIMYNMGIWRPLPVDLSTPESLLK